MREKKRCRWLALLLAVVMLLSALPTAVFAEGESSADTFYKIVHLDCGRKYFTVDWVKALIKEIAADGYTHLELAFGNDGLRFLLDDMSVTAKGTTYNSDAVKAGIQAGNQAYYDFGTNEWTQSEMDEIIAAAKAAGIEIIPLLNTPGHMDAIVTALKQIGVSNASYNGSKTTIDFGSTQAVDFTKALVGKYAAYFKSKGCTIFNMGCDEYANDIYTGGSMGFGNLVSSGKYGNFVTYVNELATIIKTAGLTPMAFNDGFYFNGNTSSGTFDTGIMISFWTSGWDGYQSESAAQLAARDHKMINTNGDYYYVLGKNDAFDSGYSKASDWNNTAFMGSTVSNPAGSMFCIWCDYPNAETETEIAEKTRLVMRAMAAEMNGEDANAIDTNAVVPGGFNADGTINTTSSGDSADTTEVINLTAGGTASRTISGFNYKNNVDRSKLDETIATVTVEGVDAVEGGTEYTEASVTCNTLISSNSKSWKAASGYYYKADDGNYYPLYAKRSRSYSWNGVTYTYTWGYSTTSSTNNVTQIGTQSTTDTGDTPNITVYTQSTAAPSDASTTITFTGVYPGTTYVTVGSTEYKINVAYKTENVSVVVDGNKTVSQASTIKGDAVVDDPSVVRVITSGSNVTFSGLKVGTTTVTVGDTIYTVTVSEEDLTGKTLTIEYWITNGRPSDANGNISYTVNATASGVYSESGADVASLLPANTTKENRTLQFWRGRLLDTTLSNSSTSGTERQTNDAGDDETYSGVEFSKVRYWGGVWSVYTENGEWVEVADKYQLVAYYLEILPVADELNVYAADWGKKADGSTSGDYLDPLSSCTISVIAVYEDGTTNPVSTTATDLRSSTIAYGYWTGGRGIGTLNLVGQEGYQIWKIEAETGSETYTSSSSAWGSFTVNTFTWDNNPMTVYEGDAVDKYTLHNDSNNPSNEGYYQNLMWDENYEAILLKVYLKAKPTEDSLTVHYVDETANQEFYNYNINVKNGTTFAAGFALNSGYTNIDNALKNNTVENSLGVVQTVTANLSKMPEIGAQYRYSEYTCKSVTRSENGKEVYLYYTFNNTHKFVIDFGLPLKITTTDLGISGDWTSADVAGEKYGTANATVGEGVSYTPTKVLPGVETLQLTLTGSTDSVTHQIYIYPASNVLYEDDFLKVATNIGSDYKAWTTEPTDSAKDAVQSAVQTTLYGYDVAYEKSTGNSMGSAWTIDKLSTGEGSQYLTTTFTGNGFDLIGTAGPDTGYVYLILQGAENKLIVIDTSYVDGGTLCQAPLAHEMLKDGNYTAYIRAAYRKPTEAAGSGDTGTQMSRAAAFSMSAAPTSLDSVYDMVDAIFADGFEIDDVEYVYFDDASALAELENSSRATYAMSYALNSATAAATADAGVNTTARHAGDTVTIDGFRVYRGTNEAYIESERGREYVNVLDKVQDDFAAYVEGKADGSGYTKETYESQGGPQNEIYLVAGNTGVVFQTNLEPGRVVQVSARAVSGTAYLNGTAIQSQTEMYYTVKVGTDGVITIGNTLPAGTTEAGMLAIANLKVPAETTFGTPTEKTLVTAFAMMRSYSAAPAEPDPEQPGTEEPAPKPVFTPETFKTKVSSLRTRSRKVVTLTITASTDVDHVVVNGKTYYPMNKLLVKLGWSKTCVFTIVDTAGASETRNFEIVAYNADGLASITYTDAG